MRDNNRNTPGSSASTSNAQEPVTELHSSQAPTMVRPANPLASPVVSESRTLRSSDSVAVCSVRASRPRVCFKVVLVKISCRGNTKEITTYAFLDGGSDATLCLESLVQELGSKDMKPTSFTMTTANLEEERFGHEVQLNVESLDGDAKFQLTNVLTTHSLPVSRRHIATNEDLRRWPHLNDISLPDTEDKKVTILIGGDRPDIIDKELDKREGEHGEPIAVKHPLDGLSMALLANLQKIVSM